MIQLIYLSFFNRDLTTSDLENILTASRRNNTQKGITGMLVVKGRAFLQVLEGDKEQIYTLYETISRDDRHRDLIRVSEEVISQRAFANWSMGFKNLDELTAVESEKLADLSQLNLQDSSLVENPSEVHALFQQFLEIEDEISLL